jgi:hypothetical protein
MGLRGGGRNPTRIPDVELVSVGSRPPRDLSSYLEWAAQERALAPILAYVATALVLGLRPVGPLRPDELRRAAIAGSSSYGLDHRSCQPAATPSTPEPSTSTLQPAVAYVEGVSRLLRPVPPGRPGDRRRHPPKLPHRPPRPPSGSSRASDTGGQSSRS